MTAHLSGLPPLLVLDSFRRDLDTRQLSTLHSGADKNGSLCLNFLELSWGYNPLKNTSEAVALYRPTEDGARMGFTVGGGEGGGGEGGGGGGGEVASRVRLWGRGVEAAG